MSTNFGTANDYNLFVLGNMNMQNTDVEGRLAVRGSATLQNYGIGANILPLPPFGTDNTFVVGGSELSATNGVNFAGDTIVSPDTTVSTYTMTNNNGSLKIGEPIDFDDEKHYLECVSISWAGIAPNGSIQIENGGLTLTGTSNTFNIFTFSANNIGGSGLGLDDINQINIIAPSESTILINVLGVNVKFGSYQIFRNGVAATRDDARYIVWNFPFALHWDNSTTAIYGSVLAPFATATTSNSQINGNVIFKNINGTTEVHNTLFIGDIPVGICEVPTSSSSSSSSTSSTSSSSSSTSSTSSSSSSTSSTSSSSSSTSSTSSSSSSTSTQNPCNSLQSAIDVVESIALEETGLANLINSESCKLQKAIKLSTDINDLVLINKSVEDTLEMIINSQMLLNMKIKKAIKLLKITINSCE